MAQDRRLTDRWEINVPHREDTLHEIQVQNQPGTGESRWGDQSQVGNQPQAGTYTNLPPVG